MNQRYIDFVPVKNNNVPQPIAEPKPVRVTVQTTEVKVTRKAAPIKATPARPVAPVKATPAHPATPAKPTAPVKTQSVAVNRTNIKAIKSEKIAKKPLNLQPKPAKKPAPSAAKPKTTFEPPKFINTSKVEKRPLSKTVYARRQEVVAKEEPTGPVAIIDKPEKDSNIGLIITVILTVILGAAVGTIAFLIIPR